MSTSFSKTVPSTLGVQLALHDLGGSSSGGRPGDGVLVAHATGFCGPMYAPLATAIEHSRCIAPDFRAHGETLRPAESPIDWWEFGEDALATASHLAPHFNGLLGFGHSMGGAALLMAEILRPGSFQAIYVYEPIIAPQQAAPQPETPLAISAGRRRDQFDSYEDALHNFGSKPPMSAFQADVLESYVRHGFRQNSDGVHLKCRRDDEAQIFANAGLCDAFSRLNEVRCPVWVARGLRHGKIGAAGFAGPVAGQLPNAELVDFPDLGHLSPFEVPKTVARDVSRCFASIS